MRFEYLGELAREFHANPRRGLVYSSLIVATILSRFGDKVQISHIPRTLTVLSGEAPNCIGFEAATPGYRFDVIALFNAGGMAEVDSELQPGPDQEARNWLAATLYVNQMAPKIVFLGETQESAEVNFKSVQEKVREISYDKMDLKIENAVFDIRSFNTATNAAELAAIMALAGNNTAVGATQESHMKRAILLSRNYGVCIYGISVKDAAEIFGYEYLNAIGARVDYGGNLLVDSKEKLELVSMIVDKYGLIQILLKLPFYSFD